MIFQLTVSKGHFSINNVGGVTVLALCTLSDHAFYLYQVFAKISKRVSELLNRHKFPTKIFKGAYSF